MRIAQGGTGQTTQTAALDALAPTTTKGDLIVHNGTDNVRLPVGSNDQVLVADSTQAAGAKWADASAGGVLDLGDYKYSARKTDISNRWLRCDGRTFGDDSSDATIEDADLFDLFAHLWLEFTDTELPMYTDSTKTTQVDRGVDGNDQDDDWDAGYCMTLPDLRGRVAMMMDDPTGSDAINRVTGSWADALGGSGGEETHTLTVNELASHTHPASITGFTNMAGVGFSAAYSAWNHAWVAVSNTGDNAAHNNLQPSIAAGNYFIYTGN